MRYDLPFLFLFFLQIFVEHEILAVQTKEIASENMDINTLKAYYLFSRYYFLIRYILSRSAENCSSKRIQTFLGSILSLYLVLYYSILSLKNENYGSILSLEYIKKVPFCPCVINSNSFRSIYHWYSKELLSILNLN